MVSQEAALAELDERLDGLMEVVRLSYLIKREGGWGAACEWGETLSLGSPLWRLWSSTHVMAAFAWYHPRQVSSQLVCILIAPPQP